MQVVRITSERGPVGEDPSAPEASGKGGRIDSQRPIEMVERGLIERGVSLRRKEGERAATEVPGHITGRQPNRLVVVGRGCREVGPPLEDAGARQVVVVAVRREAYSFVEIGDFAAEVDKFVVGGSVNGERVERVGSRGEGPV